MKIARIAGSVFTATFLTSCAFAQGTVYDLSKETLFTKYPALLSPKKDFRLASDGCSGHNLWIVSTQYPKQKVVLPLPNELSPDFAPSSFFLKPLAISQDQEFLLCQVKLVNRTNSVYLYKRVKGLRYQQIASDLNEASWPFYSRKTKIKVDYVYFDFRGWSRGSRIIRFDLFDTYQRRVVARGRFDTWARKYQ